MARQGLETLEVEFWGGQTNVPQSLSGLQGCGLVVVVLVGGFFEGNFQGISNSDPSMLRRPRRSMKHCNGQNNCGNAYKDGGPMPKS